MKKHSLIAGRFTHRSALFCITILAFLCFIAAPVHAYTNLTFEQYDYSAYSPENFDENITINITEWQHIDDTGFVPWFLWIVLPIAGLIFFGLSLYRSETADIRAGLSITFLWATAMTAPFIALTNEFLVETYTANQETAILIIPVYWHFHPFWWTMIWALVALVATLHAIRIWSGWGMDTVTKDTGQLYGIHRR